MTAGQRIQQIRSEVSAQVAQQALELGVPMTRRGKGAVAVDYRSAQLRRTECLTALPRNSSRRNSALRYLHLHLGRCCPHRSQSPGVEGAVPHEVAIHCFLQITQSHGRGRGDHAVAALKLSSAAHLRTQQTVHSQHHHSQ